jgi:antirestriction protein ArdC
LQVKEGDGEEAETRLIPMLREYTMFNVDQCQDLPDSIKAGKPMRVRNPDTRDALADQFLRSTRADIREGHGEAYYVPSKDFISMPAFEGFKGADHFYCTAFHELTHWTGHNSRLDRDLKNRFGSRDYAAEELVAELGAAFLCAEFGFDGDVRHAGYVATWIELLKADKRAFWTAASKASQAAGVPQRTGVGRRHPKSSVGQSAECAAARAVTNAATPTLANKKGRIAGETVRTGVRAGAKQRETS